MQNKTHNEFIIKTSPNGDKTILYAYLGNESIVTVPEGVTDINFFAFAIKKSCFKDVPSLKQPKFYLLAA